MNLELPSETLFAANQTPCDGGKESREAVARAVLQNAAPSTVERLLLPIHWRPGAGDGPVALRFRAPAPPSPLAA